MSQQDWEINFDVRALMDAQFPGLYRDEDNEVWNDWAEWAGYQRDYAKQLVKTQGIKLSILARAALARFLPAEFLPFQWENNPQKPRGTFEGIVFESIPEDMQKLRYHAFCSFMEALPKSSLFDLSDHPVAKHLPRLNGSLLNGYLMPSEKDPQQREWLDLDRVFECYRLQSPNEYHKEHFRAFRTLVCRAEETENEYWKQRANTKMVDMVEREIAGDTECTGALFAYTQIILEWVNNVEGPPPYHRPLAMLLIKSYLSLDLPWQGDDHGPIFSDYLNYEPSPRLDLIERGGRHYLTGPWSLLTDENRERNRSFLASIARKVSEASNDPELLAIARPIVSEDDQYWQQREVREAARRETQKQAKGAQEAEARHLFERMK